MPLALRLAVMLHKGHQGLRAAANGATPLPCVPLPWLPAALPRPLAFLHASRFSSQLRCLGNSPQPSSQPSDPTSLTSAIPPQPSLPNSTQASHSPSPSLGQAAPRRVFSSHIQGDTKLLQQLRQNPASFAQGHEILDSIVKVFTVHSRPNHFLPWQNHPKRESTGTGFVIHDRLILTNAHCIADATYVTVKRHGSGTRYRAHVQAVGHDCDLSLLSVEDDGFWDAPTSIKPLALGPVPTLQQDVRVLGYPTGGDNTSVTSGVVSRVEVAQYVHSASHLMAIQIDAAINPGNSGGPAMQGDEVVGVAFQNLPNADNIGYIIPTPVVSHFLSEVARYGQYRGYCSLGLMCQNLENPHLRKALAMPPGATGVLVNSVQQTSTACKFISKGDVLLEFNGVPIANDGTVHLRQRERIYFSWLITLLPTGQTARVKLLREGKVREIEVVMQPNDMLVPVHSYDKLPTYFIYAGLVFVPLTQPYLMEYGDDWVNSCPRRLYDKAMHTLMKQPSQQIVTLSQVLVDDVNTGYQQLQNLQVVRVNGVEVLNLAHLQQLVATPAKDGFVRFELEDDRLIAVDAVLAESAASRIADRYRVPRLASGDLATETAA
ncbi:trypsin family [Haematococcus lacustris]